MSASAASVPSGGRATVSTVVDRLARALEPETGSEAVVVAVPRTIALARRVAAILDVPFEVAPVVTIGGAGPGEERAAVTPDGHVYVWKGLTRDGTRLQTAVLRGRERAAALERRLSRRGDGAEGTWLLVARGAIGPAETAAALTWLRRHRNGRFVVAAAEWDDSSSSVANAWADRVVGAMSSEAVARTPQGALSSLSRRDRATRATDPPRARSSRTRSSIR